LTKEIKTIIIGSTNYNWFIILTVLMELSMTDWFFIKWLLAFSPIAMVLFLMVFRDWGGGRAGAAGWFTALIAAALSFGAHPELIAYSQMKGVLLSLNVLYIIWAALLLYTMWSMKPAPSRPSVSGFSDSAVTKPFSCSFSDGFSAPFFKAWPGMGYRSPWSPPFSWDSDLPPWLPLPLPRSGIAGPSHSAPWAHPFKRSWQ
jgi:hypothetical protein